MSKKKKTRKKDPTFKHNKLKAGKDTTLTLKKAEPTATGSGEFGDWELWTVKVKDASVQERNGNLIEDYTGDAVWFPSDKVKEDLAEITGGTKEKCQIKISKHLGENDEGQPYTYYEVEEVVDENGNSTGQSPPDSVDKNELTFLKDFKSFVDKKLVENNKNVFTKFGKTAPYNFDDETIEKLWEVHNE